MTQSVFKQALYRTALPISLCLVSLGVPSIASAQFVSNPDASPTYNIAADSPFNDPDIIYLEADELINNEQTQTITATGEVEGRYQDRTLRADSVVYDLQSGSVIASGNVVLVDSSGISQSADKLELSNCLLYTSPSPRDRG